MLKTSILCGWWALCMCYFVSAQSTFQNRDDQKDGSLTSEWLQSPPDSEPTGSTGHKINACGTTFNLATPYNTNNGQRGCMFDVTATNTVTVRCFDVSLYSGTTANYEVYYRAGTHVGNENNAAAWTLLGGATGITSAGNNVPTALPINFAVTIPAGQTYSFYVTNDFGGGTSYTDGTAVGNFLAGDANITVYEGVGKSYPFGLTFTVRNFNGTIFYDGGSVLDANDPVLAGEVGDAGAQLSWEIPGVERYREILMESSPDGRDFQTLSHLPLESRGELVDPQLLQGDKQFYRLKVLSAEGQWFHSRVLELHHLSEAGIRLEAVWPNPFGDQLLCKLRSDRSRKVQVQLTDLTGKVVASELQQVALGENVLDLPTQALAPGLYLLQIKSETGVLLEKVQRR